MSSSLRRTDILELSNLRNDGRKPNEIRRMRVEMGVLNVVDAAAGDASSSSSACCGSGLVEMGLTVVLATVRGPMECSRRSDELPDRAILDVSVKAAPFAPSTTDRRITNPNTDRRLIEHSHLLKRAMEASVLVHLYPKSKISIDVWVLCDDGGRLCAAINAATLALVDAGIPMKDLVCACSAGGGSDSASSSILVDLNKREENMQHGQPAVYLPCAMLPQRGTVVLAQCEARLPDLKSLERVLDAAMDACRNVFDILQAAIRERAGTLLAARSGHATVHDAFDQLA